MTRATPPTPFDENAPLRCQKCERTWPNNAAFCKSQEARNLEGGDCPCGGRDTVDTMNAAEQAARGNFWSISQRHPTGGGIHEMKVVFQRYENHKVVEETKPLSAAEVAALIKGA